MKTMVVGAIGARTTAFKTVRIDELALQKNEITMETLDLSDIFDRVAALSSSDERVKAKEDKLRRLHLVGRRSRGCLPDPGEAGRGL